MARTRVTVTSKRVTAAVRKAKKLYAGGMAKCPAAWRKGGREYTRVLGRFGAPAPRRGKHRP